MNKCKRVKELWEYCCGINGKYLLISLLHKNDCSVHIKSGNFMGLKFYKSWCQVCAWSGESNTLHSIVKLDAFEHIEQYHKPL